jgi:DNA-binding beta-propeller fold protein YncE
MRPVRAFVGVLVVAFATPAALAVHASEQGDASIGPSVPVAAVPFARQDGGTARAGRPGPIAGSATRAASPAGGDGAESALLVQVGDITGGDDPLINPAGVAVDAVGRVYVIDSGNDRVRVFDGNGDDLASWGGSGAGDGQFGFDSVDDDGAFGDVAIGPDGSVYVADPSSNRIQTFAPDGAFVLAWGKTGDGDGEFTETSGIAVDDEGRVYVADYQTPRIQVFDGDGTFLASWDGNGDGQAEFGGPLYGPNDVAVGADGFAWVTDDQNNRVYRFAPDGALAGGYGLRGTKPDQFWTPWGIAIGPDGVVYVAEEHNDRVHLLAPDGATLGVFGRSVEDPGPLHEPRFLAVGPDGLLYVADTGHGRVLVLRPAGGSGNVAAGAP